MKLNIMELDELIISIREEDTTFFQYTNFGFKNFDSFMEMFKSDLSKLSYYSTKVMFILMINYNKDFESFSLLNPYFIKKIIEEEDLLEKEVITKEYLIRFVYNLLNKEDFENWFLKTFCDENKKIKEHKILHYLSNDLFKNTDFNFGLELNFCYISELSKLYELKIIKKSIFDKIVKNWIVENNDILKNELHLIGLQEKIFILKTFSEFLTDKNIKMLTKSIIETWYDCIDDKNEINQLEAIVSLSKLDAPALNEKEDLKITNSFEYHFSNKNYPKKTSKIIKIKEEYNLLTKLKNENNINIYHSLGIPLNLIRQRIIFNSKNEKKKLLFQYLEIADSSSINEIKIEIKKMEKEMLGSLFKQLDKAFIFRLIYEFPVCRKMLSIGGTALNTEQMDLFWTILAHVIFLSDKNLKITQDDADILVLNYRY